MGDPGETLVLGTRVEIQGLQGRKDLNGRKGWVTGHLEDTGRIEVSLEGANGDRVNCKPANVVRVAAQASDACSLKSGMMVEIAGLKSRADLNGRRGVVASGADASGRVEVHLDGPNGGERVRCKPENAVVVATRPSITASLNQPRSGRASMWDRKADAPPASTESRSDGRSEGRPQGPPQSAPPPPSATPPSSTPVPPRGGASAPPPRSVPPPCFGAGDRDRPHGGPGLERVTLRDGRTEDRSRDWFCQCGERNFMKRTECMRCGAPRNGLDCQQQGPPPARVPPSSASIAGQNITPSAWEELCRNWAAAGRSRSRSRSRRRRKRRRRRRSSSSSSSRSSSKSSGSRSRSRSKSADPAAELSAEVKVSANSELDKAKEEVLQKLLKMRGEPRDVRLKGLRALLLEWHPDKNADNVEVATAVFQFLQKGKSLIDAETK
eukprot:TRINITY_DN2774_c1_g1_i1.p1 TRINITY_DN2774_c1_g1~~TRINITY_DN2774_c1_g1_i1.p1  ORF type:complete len:438 (-),score=66.01 TRINITY_DN2774_c1_g1_i1:230-1543(-)